MLRWLPTLLLVVTILASPAWGDDPPKAADRPAEEWVKLLDSKAAAEKAAAEKALLDLGWRAVPALRAAGNTSLVERIWEGLPGRHMDAGESYVLTAGAPPDVELGKLSLICESGGHSQTLLLTRLRWEATELRIDRIGFSRTPYSGVDDQKIRVRTARIPSERARALLEAVIRGTAATLEKKKGSAGGGFTTAGFHVRVAIREEDRSVLDLGFTGFWGDMNKPQFFRPSIASSIFREGFEKVRWQTRKPDDADLQFLLHRSARHAEDGWWVRERFILIVEAIGDARFLPFLSKCISSPLEDVRRRQMYAINAYAKLSGVDFRSKPFAERNVKGVRKTYLRYFEKQAKKAEKKKGLKLK